MLEPWQWAWACAAALLVGVSKTGVAGLGVLSVAIFASILPARESVGVALVVLLAGDLVAVTVYRRDASWPHLVRLFPAAAVGILVGAWMLGRLAEPMLRVLIGAARSLPCLWWRIGGVGGAHRQATRLRFRRGLR